MKKLLSKLLVLTVLLVPVGTANAVLPLIGLAYMWGASASSTIVANSIVLGTVGMGVIVGWVGFRTDPAQTEPTLVVQLAPAAAVDTPAGWTPGTGVGAPPVPPTSGGAATNSYTTSVCSANGIGASAAAACSAAFGAYSSSTAPGCGVISSASVVGGVTCRALQDNGNVHNATINGPNLTCPAGYTVSGASCTLATPTSVAYPADGKCQVKRSGSTFAVDSRDPDCTNSTVMQGITVSGSAVQVTSADGSHTSINYSSTGTTVASSSPVSGSPGVQQTTRVQTEGGASTATGVPVSGTSSQTGSGTGSLSSDTPSDTGKALCGGPGQPKCQMQIDETGTPTDGALTPQKGEFDTATDARKAGVEASGTVSSLPFSFSVAWPSEPTCTNPTLSMSRFHGSTLSVKVCEVASGLRPAMNWLMAVLTAFALFFIVIGSVKK